MNEHLKPPATPAEEAPNKPRKRWPKVIEDLFIWPPLLFDEKDDDFRDLFDWYAEAVGAETFVEALQVYEVTILNVEIRRYQFSRMQLVMNKKRAAIRNVFAMFQDREEVKVPEPIARHYIENKTAKYFSDRVFQADVIGSCDMEDYSIEAATLALALPDILTLDRLIASGQKRSMQILNNLEKRCAARRAAEAKAADKTPQR